VNKYTPREEKLNTITHAIGIVFGLIAGFLLIQKSVSTSNIWAIASYTVYAVFMTGSYLTSTFYHAEKDENRKKKLRKFDHAAIYLHIAGTYTPFTLVVLRNEGFWGWSLFGVIWTAAATGVVLSFMKLKNASKLETICYVAMGWVVVVAFKPLFDVLSIQNSIAVLWWLIAGGLFYTVGAVIYSLKKIEFMHSVWHLFVLGGSVCHAYAIWLI
jgi:hemolysin III